MLFQKSVYDLPVIINYLGSSILLDISGNIDYEALRSELEARIDDVYAENSFINYLMGKFSQKPIRMDISFRELPDSVESFLEEEVAPRYDISPIPVQPSGNGFVQGHPGRVLDTAARRPDSSRTVDLPVRELEQPAANIKKLELQLRSVIDTWQDRGQVTEVFLSDPASGQTFDLARRDRNDLIPEIAFTAASTMKLPIMISSYIRMDDKPNTITMRTLRLMITESKNDQTDWMMENIIGGPLAPYAVTEDMEKLGLRNSFLAG